jgi:signal transduction histidine kinase
MPVTVPPSRAAAPLRVLAATMIGAGALGAATVIELIDGEPSEQMWVGAAAGALFLLAVPMVRGDAAAVMSWRARLLVGAGAAAVLSVTGLWQATARSEPRVLLLLAPAVILFATAALALREAGRSSERIRAEQMRSRLEGEESERRRWAQELHDQTLQDLAAIDVTLGGLERRASATPIAGDLGDLRGMVREQIGTLRHLITEMRPLALDSLGLAPALDSMARRAGDNSDVLVRCDLQGLPDDLPPETQLVVYRIVQEALTNAIRHASCDNIQITARVRAGVLRVVVEDDGVGIASAVQDDRRAGAYGLGRIGMVERAQSLRGHATWTLAEGGGTVVALELPL